MSFLKSCILIESAGKNKYFYDREKKRIGLCHPLLYHILKLDDDGIDAAGWIDSLVSKADPVEIEHCGLFTKKEIYYYYQKFLLLKSQGYLAETDQETRLSAVLTPEMIKYNLANVRQIVFEVTDKCNLSCEYCAFGKFYGDYDRRENKSLDILSAKKLLDYLSISWNSPLNKSHGRDIYISFYGGEPLLNFRFITEIVDYAKKIKLIHNRFLFSMTTNGVLVQKYMDFLKENNFNLLISLDGNERNNSYRAFKNGKPAYAAIVDSIEKLREKYPGYFLKLVNFVALLHNKNSVPDIYDFFKKRFNKIPHIGALNTGGIKESRKKKFWHIYANINQSLYNSEDYSMIERDMFHRLPDVQELKIFLHKCSDFCFDNYFDLLFSSPGKKRIPTGTCLPFAKKLFMSVNGKLMACERIGHQFDLGYVKPGGVEIDCEKIAKKYNGYFEKMRKQCNMCYNAELCRQCIFYIKDIENANPVCKGFKKKVDYGKYLAFFLNYIEKKPDAYSRALEEVDFE